MRYIVNDRAKTTKEMLAETLQLDEFNTVTQ